VVTQICTRKEGQRRACLPLIEEAAIDSAEDDCLPFEDSAISNSLLLGLLMEAFLCLAPSDCDDLSCSASLDDLGPC